MQYNKSMLQKMSEIKDNLTDVDIAKIDTFSNTIISELHLINDCILVSLPTFDVTNKNEIKKYVTDEVGLEASQNEIHLNIEMSMDLITVDFALCFFKTFK